MSRRRAPASAIAWEIHIADSPRRVVNFRYPTNTTNPGKDWKSGPDDVLVASCCFAVLGEGDAYQWPGHSKDSAEYVAASIPGGVVVEGKMRPGDPVTSLVGPDPRLQGERKKATPSKPVASKLAVGQVGLFRERA